MKQHLKKTIKELSDKLQKLEFKLGNIMQENQELKIPIDAREIQDLSETADMLNDTKKRLNRLAKKCKIKI